MAAEVDRSERGRYLTPTDADIEDARIAVPERVDDRIACAPCRERRVDVDADCRSIRTGGAACMVGRGVFVGGGITRLAAIGVEPGTATRTSSVGSRIDAAALV